MTFSVQTVTGGQCMTVLLTATWPSVARIPNTIPEDQGITTSGMLGFLLYFLLQLPFLCIPYHRIQYFFAFKSVIAPIVFLAVFGSTLHKAGGTIKGSSILEPSSLGGSALAWAFFSNLNSVLGNYATLGLNISDFARYAKKPSNQNIQIFAIPFIFTLIGLLGIFTAAASEKIYGEVVWNPIVIIGDWSSSGSHGGRAASAFGAIGLIIVTLGINISANSISAANDLVSFCPKYINIRRGAIACGIHRRLGVRSLENSRFSRSLPGIPQWLHNLPRPDDCHPHHRLLHHTPRQRLRAGYVRLPWNLPLLRQVRNELAGNRCSCRWFRTSSPRLHQQHRHLAAS